MKVALEVDLYRFLSDCLDKEAVTLEEINDAVGRLNVDRRKEEKHQDYSIWVKGMSGRYFCLRCLEPRACRKGREHDLPDKCPSCGAVMVKPRYAG